eukprot:3811741-Rhodomonas_salina.1
MAHFINLRVCYSVAFVLSRVVCTRGTYGLVVAAEYRKTPVAVKRVIPPVRAYASTPWRTGPGLGTYSIDPRALSVQSDVVA